MAVDTASSEYTQRGLTWGSRTLRVAGDILNGAQNGLGVHWDRVESITPAIAMNAVPIVLKLPRMFENVPKFNDNLQALFEKHAKSISGIGLKYTTEMAETPAGYDGQSWKTPTRTTRDAVSPTFVWDDVNGMLVWEIMQFWCTSVASPDTMASRITQLRNSDTTIDPQLFHDFSATIMFIVFDRTMRPENILKTVIVSNMMPLDTTEFEIKKDLSSAPAPAERSINFTGVIMHNDRIEYLGQQIAKTLAMHTVDYQKATPAMESISSMLNSYGMKGDVAAAAQSFIIS